MAGESQLPPDNAPDPTTATYDALNRGLKAERDFTVGEIRVLVTRLDGMDQATKLLSEEVNRTPTRIETEIKHVRERTDLQMAGVEQRFADGDRARERESRDNKVAVDAAFAAQKEAASMQDAANTKAIDKSETATAKTIATNADLSRASVKAIEGQIVDLKERFAKLESARQGGRETRTDLYALIAAAGAVIAIGVAIFSQAAPG